MAHDLFRTWLGEDTAGSSAAIRLFRENPTTRATALPILKTLLIEHFVGAATVLAAGGYQHAADTIINSLPTRKQIQSGDLGELLAAEYLNAETAYTVPILKLRWKSDRQTALHGNDVIGIDSTRRSPRVLKAECKSRVRFSPSDAREAVRGLDGHDGRPNPSTLAFITKRLYELGRDEEASVFRDIQSARALRPRNVAHLIFVLSGNNPSAALSGAPPPANAGMARSSAAIVITDHSDFVTEVFSPPYGA
jgi:hypothetical protein